MAQYLKLIGPKFFIFGLVFVSRNFEVGTNVSCEESKVKNYVIIAHRLKSVSFCAHDYVSACVFEHGRFT